MGADSNDRYCPICQRFTSERVCSQDRVNTVLLSSLGAGARALQAGQAIAEGEFRIDKALGSGGAGTVYAARQVSMNRPVAIKVLHEDALSTLNDLQRFFLEAKRASQLSDPHVVHIYKFGVDESINAPFIAMEFIEGLSLGQVIADEGPLSQLRAAKLLEQIARALVAAHSAGLVHRDLKPDNVMVSVMPDGRAHCRVLDFGVAKSILDDASAAERLTVSGSVVGTPLYMSPEQAKATAVDGRSDLYALGCLFHEMLSGAPPFTGRTIFEVMRQHAYGRRPPFPQPVDGEQPHPVLAELHRRLLMADPEDRPADAQAVLDALGRVTAAAVDASSAGVNSLVSSAWDVGGAVTSPPAASSPAAAMTMPSSPAPPVLPLAMSIGLDTPFDAERSPPDTEGPQANIPPLGHRRWGRWWPVAGLGVPVAAGLVFVVPRTSAVVGPAPQHLAPPNDVSVALEPAGARDAATSPVKDAPLPTRARTATVRAPPPTTPKARPTFRWVTLESEPPRASVFVNGRRVGTTPYRIKVPPGGMQVVLRAKGCDPEHVRLTRKHRGRHKVVLQAGIFREPWER